MSDGPETEERPRGGGSWPGDAGARRLLRCVSEACAAGEDLPARLAAGLRAALGMLAADASLARTLTVDPWLGADEIALAAQREWIDRFGGLLLAAAADDPRASREPSYLAPFVVGGVRFQIGRLVLNGEASELPRLLPGLVEAVLAYYFEPGEPRRLARAALDV
jgi:hypothetical protein